MRRAIYRGPEETGLALVRRVPHVHLATTSADGRPILKTVHAVLLPGERGGHTIAFHAAPAGEKLEAMDRPAVVAAEEVIASIPSWFLDETLACPATTFYVGVQAHGTLREVRDPERKAMALQALMEKHQPEGKHAPIDATSPLYRKSVAGLLVAEVTVERLDCKEKLGQNRTPPQRMKVIEALWKRGAAEDVLAIAFLLRRFPELPTPSFLAPAPPGVELLCHLAEGEAREAAELLADAYWLTGTSTEERARALLASPALVGARDEAGHLVAVARATSDGRTAWIYDVLVEEAQRGRGVGDALMRLLLAHPVVRGVRHVRLSTRDKAPFYRRHGFGLLEERPRHPWRSVDMVRAGGDAVRT